MHLQVRRALFALERRLLVAQLADAIRSLLGHFDDVLAAFILGSYLLLRFHLLKLPSRLTGRSSLLLQLSSPSQHLS